MASAARVSGNWAMTLRPPSATRAPSRGDARSRPPRLGLTSPPDIRGSPAPLQPHCAPRPRGPPPNSVKPSSRTPTAACDRRRRPDRAQRHRRRRRRGARALRRRPRVRADVRRGHGRRCWREVRRVRSRRASAGQRRCQVGRDSRAGAPSSRRARERAGAGRPWRRRRRQPGSVCRILGALCPRSSAPRCARSPASARLSRT
jgi:hypothetical protein